MPEQLAGAEHVEHLAVADDLDRAVPDHPQMPDGRRALGEHGVAGPV